MSMAKTFCPSGSLTIRYIEEKTGERENLDDQKVFIANS